MPTLALLNQEGQQVGNINLNDSVFGIEPNTQVLYDVVNAQRAAMRQGTHSTKTRAEVSGGGRKPWKQKGTGRARQGSIRSPQWRGGGIVFGPTPRSYEVKVNKKVKQLALKSALSSKVANNELIALDKIVYNEIKTKNVVETLNKLNINKKAIIAVDAIDNNLALSVRNVAGVELTTIDNLSVYDILRVPNLIVTEAAIRKIEEVLA